MDPHFMGFRSLRVINDDRIAGGGGFPTHPHRDMEILTYILDGALEHKDSLGTGSVIRRGDVQVMSAGTGIRHSEFNPSSQDSTHLLQIWFLPERNNLAPRYDQKSVRVIDVPGKFHRIASHADREDAVRIFQDIELDAGIFAAGDKAAVDVAPGRFVWAHLATGAATVNGHELVAGDAVAMAEESRVAIEAREMSEILVFNLG
jgi:redox-sensitive bicupin YhaK (pirin superfamily)